MDKNDDYKQHTVACEFFLFYSKVNSCFIAKQEPPTYSQLTKRASSLGS